MIEQYFSGAMVVVVLVFVLWVITLGGSRKGALVAWAAGITFTFFLFWGVVLLTGYQQEAPIIVVDTEPEFVVEQRYSIAGVEVTEEEYLVQSPLYITEKNKLRIEVAK